MRILHPFALLVPMVLAAAPAGFADAPIRATAPASAEALISLDFKDADIVDVVRLMAEVGQFQVVVDPGVSCKLTLKLKSVPWDTALDLALRVCSLGQETDNGIVRVAPVAKLTAEYQARRQLAEAQKLNRPLRTVRYTLSYARAAELAPLIKKFLSPRGDVVFDARTNTLIVTDVD
jgi:type II secretory pathway component HofQ